MCWCIETLLPYLYAFTETQKKTFENPTEILFWNLENRIAF